MLFSQKREAIPEFYAPGDLWAHVSATFVVASNEQKPPGLKLGKGKKGLQGTHLHSNRIHKEAKGNLSE